jgi:collagenase-like PrtC family protease
MELVVQLQSEETLSAALAAGVAGVAVHLPLGFEASMLDELPAWQAAARRRGTKFFLVWDWLVAEPEFARAAELLAPLAELAPDGLSLRDLGLAHEARERHSQLPLLAAANFGAHNAPGLKLARDLGFSGAALAGMVSLRDLGLIRRQLDMRLEVGLPPGCQGLPGLCLLPEYLGVCCPCSYGLDQDQNPAQAILASLELLAGLVSLGVEAVQLDGEQFEPATLARVLELCQTVRDAATTERPGVMAAAREVLSAFGEQFRRRPASAAACAPAPASPVPTRRTVPVGIKAKPRPGTAWLEVRDFQEAVALFYQWRDTMILGLDPENYQAFLPELHRWSPRRLVWRLPPVIREQDLAFYQKAAETLVQGGFSRFVASDWGGVALIRRLGGEVYGDQSLGIRNVRALKVARQLGVSKICLPPALSPAAWQEFVLAGPPGSFWSYLHHFPPLGVYPYSRNEPLPAPVVVGEERLRWMREGDLLLLCRRSPQQQDEFLDWFLRYKISPLVTALPRSGLQRGRLPALLAPEPRKPGPDRKPGPRR